MKESVNKSEKFYNYILQHYSSEFNFESAPLFSVPISDVVLRVNETATFTCRVCGKPKPTVTWKGPEDRIIISGPGVHMSYTDDGVATLQVWYHCRAIDTQISHLKAIMLEEM